MADRTSARSAVRATSRAGGVVTGAVGEARARVGDIGGYLREQRQQARMSLRQLADVAGVSNPYLSQVERGLRRPSAEVLQQIARGLRISAEVLYVRAGLLDVPEEGASAGAHDVPSAVAADPRLTTRQRQVLLDVYESFVGDLAAPLANEDHARDRHTGGDHRAGRHDLHDANARQGDSHHDGGHHGDAHGEGHHGGGDLPDRAGGPA